MLVERGCGGARRVARVQHLVELPCDRRFVEIDERVEALRELRARIDVDVVAVLVVARKEVYVVTAFGETVHGRAVDVHVGAPDAGVEEVFRDVFVGSIVVDDGQKRRVDEFVEHVSGEDRLRVHRRFVLGRILVVHGVFDFGEERPVIGAVFLESVLIVVGHHVSSGVFVAGRGRSLGEARSGALRRSGRSKVCRNGRERFRGFPRG